MLKEVGLYKPSTADAKRNLIRHKSLFALLLQTDISPGQIELAWSLFQSAVGNLNPSHHQAIGEVIFTLRGERGDPLCIRQAHKLLANYFDFELDNTGHSLYHQLNDGDRLQVLRFARTLYSTGWQPKDHLSIQHRTNKKQGHLNNRGSYIR